MLELLRRSQCMQTARAEAPKSLRAIFGTDNTQNACHGSDSPENADLESAFFFGPGPKKGQCATMQT